MKTLVAILAISILLSSCSKPSPDIMIANSTHYSNQSIQIANMSVGGDVTYIKMNGIGTKDCCTPTSKETMIDDKSFCFKYAEPGDYKIEVIVESTSFFGGTETTTKSKDLAVLDPNPKPIIPPVITVDKSIKQIDKNEPTVRGTLLSPEEQNIQFDRKNHLDR